MNFHQFNNHYQFEKAIESLMGREIFPIEKQWILSGTENNWDSGSTLMEPEVEPADPLSFVEVLELLVPNITFLQFKKIEAYDIWSSRVWTTYGSNNNHTYIYAEKVLNLENFLNALKSIFPEK